MNYEREKKKAEANFKMSEMIELMMFLNTCYWLSIIPDIYYTDGVD